MRAFPRWLGILTAVSALGACTSPSRVEHQEITGVDRPREGGRTGSSLGGESSDPGEELRPAAGSDSATPPKLARGVGLEAFAADLAAAVAAAPGPVAVFPALSRGEPAAPRVDRLGESFMEQTAELLRIQGVAEVWDGPELADRLRASNRSPEHLQRVSDAMALGERIGAAYVVHGTLEKGFDGRRLDRRDFIELDWQARSLEGGRSLAARWRERVDRGDEDFPRTIETMARAGSWPTGPAPTPDLWTEIGRYADALSAELVSTRPEFFRNPDEGALVVAVLPTELPESVIAQRELWEFGSALEAAWNTAEAKAGPDGALEQPVRVGSQQYGRLADALDDYRRLRRELASAPAGLLAERLGSRFLESLKQAASVPIERSLDLEAEQVLLWTLRLQARRFREDDTVDPETILELQSQGARLLLRTAIESILDRHQLRVSVQKLETGERVERTMVFEAMFSPALRRELGQ